MDSARSYARITKADLKRLARIAERDREDFFGRHKEFALLYRKRLLCVALGGSGALHYLNGVTGVREFKVWSFYAQHAEAPFPVHQISHADFGASKFGRGEDLPETYKGRRVVLQGRSIDALPTDDALEAVQRYLRSGLSPSARELAAKAVVMLEPQALLGMEAWPSLVLPPRR